MKITIMILFFMITSISSAQSNEYVEAINYGGKVELKRFLQQEINYPARALKNKKEGTVELYFRINPKIGIAEGITIKNSVSESIDAEALRLTKKLLFLPNHYMEKQPNLFATLKLKFSLKNYKRFCKKRGYEKIELTNPEVNKSNVVFSDNKVSSHPKIVFENELDNISSFIQKNMKYPEGTLRLSITGTVKLSFVVEPTGRITNIRVLKDVGGGATNEAIRLLKLTKWSPGKKDGKFVRVNKTFEVNFNLSNQPGMDVTPSSY